jgi:hypothetical protein
MQDINIIFPSCPLATGCKKVADFWSKEAEAAKSSGFGISIITDANQRGPLVISNNNAEAYLYRGWIAKPQYYQEMCQAASAPLLNNYNDYMWSYDFPKWYCELNGETPASFSYIGDEISNLGLAEIAKQVSERAGPKPLIIKDWLKSRKHEWFDACFIKDASDANEIVRVMTNFFNLQGRDFYGGLVFRDFLSLKKLGAHPKSKMPIPLEFRTFFLNQEPVSTSMYWQNDINYPDGVEYPPQAWLEDIGKKMRSPFVALDIAQGEDGKWWVIEVNDAGIAGYPDHIDSNQFYKDLYLKLCRQVQSS